jgi:hypothetical protein
MKLHHSLLLLTLSVKQAFAWGAFGHRTIAYIAQEHFTAAAKSYASGILAGEDISDASVIPDSVYRDEYPYSAPWHFIDANDNPPTSCSVDYTRDCGSAGCVVSALVNMVY